jgi:hypothetical protein
MVMAMAMVVTAMVTPVDATEAIESTYSVERSRNSVDAALP